MQVFISWSGDTSRRVADALHWWIPRVMQGVGTFSSEDIDKGADWAHELRDRLKTAAFAVVCLTPYNLTSPWLHYEAGVLRASDDVRVCPVLFGVPKSAVLPPLSHVQLTAVDQGDVTLLMRSMNKVAGRPLTDAALTEAMDVWWPLLVRRLDAIPAPASAPPADLAFRLINRHLRTTLDLLRVRAPGVEYRALVTVVDEHRGIRRTVLGDNIKVDPEVALEVPAYFGIAGEALRSGSMKCGDVTSENRNLGPDGQTVPGVWERVSSVVAFPLVGVEGVIGTVNFDADKPLAEAHLDDRREVQPRLGEAAELVGYLLRATPPPDRLVLDT